MSERFGMADGRCFTNYQSSRIMNDSMMAQQKIPLADNYKYRQHIAKTNVVPAPKECLAKTLLPDLRDSRIQ